MVMVSVPLVCGDGGEEEEEGMKKRKVNRDNTKKTTFGYGISEGQRSCLKLAALAPTGLPNSPRDNHKGAQ